MEKVISVNIKPEDTKVIFDKNSKQWNKNPEYNLMFIKTQQNYMNDMLKARSHVFLNEVYDALGFARTQAGAVTGWILKEGNETVNILVHEDEITKQIELDFKVDGVIADLI